MIEVFGALDPFEPKASWPFEPKASWPFEPKASWDELRSQSGERVASAVIDDASHALFPEQPDRVAQAMLPWLDRHRCDAAARGRKTV